MECRLLLNHDMLHVPLRLHRNAVVFFLIGALWIASFGLGMRALFHHEQSPAAPKNFPAQSALFLATDRPTLVLLASAQSSASELARVMSELEGKIKAYVLFEKSENAQAKLWRDLAVIPGVTPVGDEDGGEVRRFAAGSSDEALLFAADGRLLFSGSLEHATAHLDGGESLIASLVKSQPASQISGSVFALARPPVTDVAYRK